MPPAGTSCILPFLITSAWQWPALENLSCRDFTSSTPKNMVTK